MVLAHFSSHIVEDAEALGELYDRYAHKVYAYLYRRLGDAALAEDLTGDVFLRVLQAIRSGRTWRESFRAWLYRIAHNLVVDHYRRRPPVPPVPVSEHLAAGGQDDPVGMVEETMERARIQAALEQLTPEQQEVLALRFGEGLKTRQVARVMGKTPGAVEGLQRRAVASLRRILSRGESA
jgi:RNA polymerase sigma-70 factor (ECF subfamily)